MAILGQFKGLNGEIENFWEDFFNQQRLKIRFREMGQKSRFSEILRSSSDGRE